ncbi:hypothetical protein CHU98_g847 [Xylaria longipes]|nr:hypothetical protein CHU98_g847 [Xylaria longipes]
MIDSTSCTITSHNVSQSTWLYQYLDLAFRSISVFPILDINIIQTRAPQASVIIEIMDRDWQEALFESWADSDVVLRRRNSNDTRTDSSPVKTPNHGAGDNKNEPLTAKSSKGEEGPYSETGMPTEV